jgi:hypothetical protein
MRNSFDNERSYTPVPLSPRPDESGRRLIPQRKTDQDKTREIDEAALEYVNRRRDARVEPTPTQETTTYSAERLHQRLDASRAMRARGDIDEIKETYALNKDVEPTRVMAPRMSFAEALRREHEQTKRSREEQAALAARPPINPEFDQKLNEIIEKRLGKDAAALRRPRLVVTGAPPAPLDLGLLMKRSHEEPTEIEDLTEFAEEVEPEIEQTPIERKTNTVILARNNNVPLSMRST